MKSTWVVIPTLGVAWIALAQVVSFQGLAIWVICGSLLSAGVVSVVAKAGDRGKSGKSGKSATGLAWVGLALFAGIAMTAVVAVLTEAFGGTDAGPVTRAAIMTSGCAVAMVWLLHTRYPATLLLPALLLMGGALGLGAAEQVGWLVGMWVVAAALTLAALGPYTRTDLVNRRRLIPFALALLAAGLAGLVAILVMGAVVTGPWTIPGAGDPVVSEPIAAEPVAPVVEPLPSESAVEQVITSALSWLVIVAVLLLLLLLIAVVAQVLWWVWVAWRWRRWRRRLNRGNPEVRAIGAWNYVRLRRTRFDHPLPVHASPDVAVELATNAGETAIAVVAHCTALVAFNPEAAVDSSVADTAWNAVTDAGRRPHGTWRQKWRWRNRSPRRAQREMADVGSGSVGVERSLVN